MCELYFDSANKKFIVASKAEKDRSVINDMFHFGFTLAVCVDENGEITEDKIQGFKEFVEDEFMVDISGSVENIISRIRKSADGLGFIVYPVFYRCPYDLKEFSIKKTGNIFDYKTVGIFYIDKADAIKWFGLSGSVSKKDIDTYTAIFFERFNHYFDNELLYDFSIFDFSGDFSYLESAVKIDASKEMIENIAVLLKTNKDYKRPNLSYVGNYKEESDITSVIEFYRAVALKEHDAIEDLTNCTAVLLRNKIIVASTSDVSTYTFESKEIASHYFGKILSFKNADITQSIFEDAVREIQKVEEKER